MNSGSHAVPSLSEQHQLVTFVHRYLAQFLSEPRKSDVTAIARDFFLIVTQQLGEKFWARIAWQFGSEHLTSERSALADLSPAPLTSEQLTHCTEAFWHAVLLRIPCASAAVREYCYHLRQAQGAPGLSACVEEFLADKAAQGVSRRVLGTYRRHLNAPLTLLANVPPREISPTRIDQLLLECPSHGIRDDRHRILFTLFRWCVQKRYAIHNPVPQLRNPAPVRFLFSPCQVRQILRLGSRSDQLAYWALAFFAGLRHSELRRLDQLADPWSLFRSSPTHFELPSEVTSNAARIVRKTAQCTAWIDWLCDRNLPILPRNWTQRLAPVWRTALARWPDVRHRRARPYSVLPAKPNGITRSTHIIYRLARGDSFHEIALETGLTTRRVEMFSPAGVKRGRVRDFFAITPDCLKKTVP